ncbi:MAG: Uncharacterized protein FD163_1901 [Hyphomonadaceae bacterium]|nr:MAG: Uncharacterized protein FD128_2506 [Hyphomonadaceae bacterium]KAF0184327.1 MAG: Uncharacterized protein FD163_1901 [Hyphomonadaceae bacterium]
MSSMIIKTKTRFFLAVEGESEQSFISWVQMVCNNLQLAVHLDAAVLGGKSYDYMLDKAVKERDKKNRSKAKKCILLVDADVGNFANGWSCQDLKERASKANFEVCFQRPNHEALLCQLFAGYEQKKFANSKAADSKLKKLWSNYKKPANAYQLSAQFCGDDLFRAAAYDSELKKLLTYIGLMPDGNPD